jgi:hypothetical protein
MSSRAYLAAIGLGLLLLAPVASAADSGKNPEKSDADILVQWFDLLYDRVKADAFNPVLASRIYGLAGVTAYEAVQPGAKKKPKWLSLQGQLAGFDATVIPVIDKKSRHWPTVVNYALHTVLTGLFTGKQDSIDAFLALRDSAQLGFPKPPKGKLLERSIARGEELGAAILLWAADDGSAEPCTFVPDDQELITGPGSWQGAPPGFGPNPLLPCWGSNRTLVLADGNECDALPHPTFDTSATSLFYANALEVFATVELDNAEYQTIANYWSDGPGATGTPGGHWVDLVRQTCVNESLSLIEGAAAFARVGLALHDAFIQCWNVKYETYLMRPVTYIQANVAGAGAWLSFITTPGFPTYTSGHSTQSGAVVRVLEEQFGYEFAFTDTTHTDHGFVVTPVDGPRSFDSLDEAGREAAISRLYGGIHYRFDNDNGFEAGTCVGQTIVDSVEFRTGEDDADDE